MKKITIVTRNMLAGGAERVIAQLSNYFVSNGFMCQIIAMYKNEVFYKLDNRVELLQIEKPDLENGTIKDKIFRYRELRKIIVESNPDIILSLPEEIGIYVVIAMLGTNIPVVVSERNNPWVMPYNKISRIMRKIAYQFVDGLIFQTEGAREFFSNSVRNKGVILPNPLDLSRLPEPYDGEREKVVVSVGRLESQKNFGVLIEAFDKFWSKHRDYKLIIYGEGSERKYLEKIIRTKESFNNIFLPGRDAAILEKIRAASLFVLSSDYEGVPNALIEALSIGIPCISTDCKPGGAKYLIQDSINGFLVPIQDSDLLANRMSYVIDNPTVGSSISSEGIKTKHRFDSNVVSKQWEDYLDLIANKKKRV